VSLFVTEKESDGMSASEAMDEATRREWRELGFYYEKDDQAKRWRFVGSRAGLMKFHEALLAYVADDRNSQDSQHEHYGPYMYLEVMTWPEAGADGHSIHGTIDDLRRLAGLIGERLASTLPGDRFVIGPEYSPSAEYSMHFEVMEDGFDPVVADTYLSTTAE
jgi:hypothetical protein